MANASNESQFTTDESVKNGSDPLFPQRPTLPLASIIFGLATGVTGMFANAVVFVVLVFARRHFGSNVNTLIANQSLMDLFACIFLIIGFVMSFPGAPQNYLELGEVGNNVICFVFRQRVMSIVCQNAEKIGLLVIGGEFLLPVSCFWTPRRSWNENRKGLSRFDLWCSTVQVSNAAIGLERGGSLLWSTKRSVLW